MAKLVFLGEKFGARVYEFVPEKTTVGRGDHNTLVIRDESVSNAHCEILVNGPEVIVHDLGSANGTYVNGARVNGQCQVKDSQILRFGSVEARLDLGMHEWEDTSTEETAVLSMKRIIRDQRREKKNPKPADPSMTLEAEPGAEMGDHTVLITRPATASAEPKSSAPFSTPVSAAVDQPKKSFMGIVVSIVILLGLAVVVWWFVWGRK